MAEISRIEKLKLEKLFEMDGGYILDFSNRTFNDFVYETLNVEVYADKFADNGESKANRLRTVWQKETNYNIGKLTSAMLEYWKQRKLMSYQQVSQAEQNIFEECNKIAQRLLQDITVEEIEVIRDDEQDFTFDRLAKSIRASIEKNEPEEALDRLHTYVMKFVRRLCEKHSIEFKKEESLNAIFGKYVKFVVAHDKIESQMTERILKYSINVIEAFNDIRNNKSFAHDNQILNYAESLLIFNNITNTIKFVESIENEMAPKVEKQPEETSDWDDLPF